MKDRRALFVVNPALPRTGPRFGDRLLEMARELGWDGSLLITRSGLNVEQIGAALSRGDFQLVVAAGGDGTVAEVMAAAHQIGIPVAILPRGTANIVARELGVPATWRKALRQAVQRFPQTRSVDLARVNDGYSALAAGMGFDTTVMRHTPRALKYWIGRAAYLVAGAWWLPRAPLFSCTIKADGEELAVEAVAVLVANAGMLGAAPFRFAPGIAIDDGWLDLVIYRPQTAMERGRVVWGIVSQRLDGSGILHRRVRSIEIKAPQLQWHQVDGDVYRGNVLKADVVPGGVEIVV